MSARDLMTCLMVAVVAACSFRASGGVGVGGGGAPAEETAGPPPEAEEAPPGEGEDQGAVEGEGGEPGGAAGAVRVEEIRDDSGKVYRVSQGERGAPAVVGCADGQREAFVDASAFPRIAGCLGSWPDRQSLRAPRGRQVCGDDAGQCDVPASLCGPGWRVCGATGAIADLTQVSAEDCEQAGGGRFSAAISHCENQNGCEYDRRANGDYECFRDGWCSESVCCGGDCGDFGVCADGVWPQKTHIAIGTDQGCGATTSRRAGGVLCCRQ